MTDILKSIYLLLGKYVEPVITEESYVVHAEKIFTQLDQNQDGIITVDEFCDTCSKVSRKVWGSIPGLSTDVIVDKIETFCVQIFFK